VQRSRYHPVHRGLATTASTGTARQRCTPNPRPVSGANRHGLLGGSSGFDVRGARSDFPRTSNPKPRTVLRPFSRWLGGHIRRGACSSGFHHAPIRCERSPTDSSASTPCGAGIDNRHRIKLRWRLLPASLVSRPMGRSWHLSRMSAATCRRLPGFNGPFTLHHSGYEPRSLVGAKHSSAKPFPSSGAATNRRIMHPR
jgi:hypothetical protein